MAAYGGKPEICHIHMADGVADDIYIHTHKLRNKLKNSIFYVDIIYIVIHF